MESEERSYPSWYPAFEQKAAYQRNMLFSLAIVSVMTAVFALAVYLLEPVEEMTTLAVGQEVAIRPVQPAGGISNARIGSCQTGESRRLRTEVRSLDFTANFRIVPDIGSNLPALLSDSISPPIGPVAMSLAPEMPSQWPASDEGGEGFNLGYGELDFGLGDDQPFLPGPRVSWPKSPGAKLPGERPMIIFASLNPRYLENTNDTGRVVVDLTIDKRNHVTWTILEEKPEHRGFGRAYDDMLLRSKFIAGSRLGEKVDSRIVVVARICLTCEATLEVVQGDVIVGRVQESPTQ